MSLFYRSWGSNELVNLATVRRYIPAYYSAGTCVYGLVCFASKVGRDDELQSYDCSPPAP